MSSTVQQPRVSRIDRPVPTPSVIDLEWTDARPYLKLKIMLRMIYEHERFAHESTESIAWFASRGEDPIEGQHERMEDSIVLCE